MKRPGQYRACYALSYDQALRHLPISSDSALSPFITPNDLAETEFSFCFIVFPSWFCLFLVLVFVLFSLASRPFAKGSRLCRLFPPGIVARF